MAQPKIALSDKLQEVIAKNQEEDCLAAKEILSKLDDWVSDIISGYGIGSDSSADARMKILGIINEIRNDYKAYIS